MAVKYEDVVKRIPSEPGSPLEAFEKACEEYFKDLHDKEFGKLKK